MAPVRIARDDSIQDVLHGVVIDDPYRWLESVRPDRETWLIDKTQAARAHLRQLRLTAGVESLLRSLRHLQEPAKAVSSELAWPCGSRVLSSKVDPDSGGTSWAVRSVGAVGGDNDSSSEVALPDPIAQATGVRVLVAAARPPAWLPIWEAECAKLVDSGGSSAPSHDPVRLIECSFTAESAVTSWKDLGARIWHGKALPLRAIDPDCYEQEFVAVDGSRVLLLIQEQATGQLVVTSDVLPAVQDMPFRSHLRMGVTWRSSGGRLPHAIWVHATSSSSNLRRTLSSLAHIAAYRGLHSPGVRIRLNLSFCRSRLTDAFASAVFRSATGTASLSMSHPFQAPTSRVRGRFQ